MRHFLITLCFCMLASFTSVALAQTPDGDPPSVEQDCANETGAAFGLCNAYCEAMDCDCPTAEDPLCEPNASATACTRVKERYQRASGNLDLPCDDTEPPPPPATCPCGMDASTYTTDFDWSDDEFDSGFSSAGFLWDNGANGAAPFPADNCADGGSDPALWDAGAGLSMSVTDVYDGSTNLAGVRATADGGFECFASNDASFPVSGTLVVTLAEAAACYVDLAQECP